MVDPSYFDIVFHKGSINTRAKFWNNKERDSPGTCRSTVDLCQHKVDHIFNSIMVPGRDKSLLPFDPVISLVCWKGGGCYVGKGTSRMGFGKGHGSLPSAGKHGGKIGVNKILAAKGEYKFGRSCR